jgi:hypothetical protein
MIFKNHTPPLLAQVLYSSTFFFALNLNNSITFNGFFGCRHFNIRKHLKTKKQKTKKYILPSENSWEHGSDVFKNVLRIYYYLTVHAYCPDEPKCDMSCSNSPLKTSRVAWCSLIVTRSWTRPWPWPAWPSRCTRSSPSRWLWGGPGKPQAPRTHFHRPRAPQRPCAVGAQPFGLDSEPLLGRGRAKARANEHSHKPFKGPFYRPGCLRAKGEGSNTRGRATFRALSPPDHASPTCRTGAPKSLQVWPCKAELYVSSVA